MATATAVAARRVNTNDAAAVKRPGSKDDPQILVPFIRASRERTELVDSTARLMTTSSQPIGPIDIPAIGFLRHLILEVTLTAGNGAGVVAHEDAPFSALNDIQVTDVNGNPIFGPISGYHAFLAEKYGAYSFISDARQRPSFSAVTASGGNATFVLRIPIEITGRDAMGSLANMNSSQTYKLRYTIAPSSAVYTTPPGTALPTVTVRASLEAWNQPRGQSAYGDAEQTVPPGHGITQYWSSAVYLLGSGEQTIRLTRVGNLVRTLVLVFRNNSNIRSTNDFPDPVRLEYDGTLVESLPLRWFRDRIAERYGYVGAANAANGLDAGVYVFDFHHDLDGKPGWEMRNGYLRTTQATRLDLRGIFGAAGQLTVLTNDIAVPAGALMPQEA